MRAARRLEVGEVPVADGIARQIVLVELEPLARRQQVDAVLLVDHFAPSDAPCIGHAHEAVVGAAVAGDVDGDALQRAAHEQHEPRLGDGAIAVQLNGAGADEMLRETAAGRPRARETNEFGRRPDEPGGVLNRVGRVEAAELVPAARVAPQRPVRHGFYNRRPVAEAFARHSGWIPAWRSSAGHFSASRFTKSRVSSGDMEMMRQPVASSRRRTAGSARPLSVAPLDHTLRCLRRREKPEPAIEHEIGQTRLRGRRHIGQQ